MRKFVDKKLFNWKPVHRLNGVPWPRISTSEQSKTDVPLKENYLLRSMDYLDTDEAKPIFEKQADIIMKNNIQGIIDVGCRIGRVNDILQDRNYTNYHYMGFDTSIEPIQYSNLVWESFNNIEYRCASWDNLEDINVAFKVDCVIWSGVLLYRPTDHLELFERLTIQHYNAKFAIIQEPLKIQKHWVNGLELQTIADDLDEYKRRYPVFHETLIDANIFSGRRKIVEIGLC